MTIFSIPDVVDGITNCCDKMNYQIELINLRLFKNYNDTYYLGNPLEISSSAEDLMISDTALGDGTALVTYRFTDMYGANHWTQTIKR